MFDAIIKAALAGVSDDIKGKLADELKDVAQDFISKNVISQVSRVILKGIDEIVEKAVKHLPKEQVIKVAGSYTHEIDQQFVQLNEAIVTYIPLQVAVEVAKRQHGKNSAEANAARAERAKGIEEVKEEFGDLFGSILGGHVED